MNIWISNQQKISPIKREWVRGIVKRVLKAEGIKADEVSIVFCNDAFIHELNKGYRGIDRPTDVLSFSLVGEGGEVCSWQEAVGRRDENKPLDIVSTGAIENRKSKIENQLGIASLGEVIISVETASRQAEEYGHCLEKELEVLLIHGVLHLIGYDHSVEDWEQGEMYEKQMGLMGEM